MRLFVAIDPSEPVRQALGAAIEEGRALAPDARWVRPEAIHLTLAFLGQVEDTLAAPIEQALAQLAPRHRPVTLRARGTGAFGSQTHPRVLWVGLEGQLGALQALQRAVEEALVPLGHRPEEREFRPHLTLARSREMRGDGALARARELLDGDFGEFTSGALSLYESRLSPGGAKYRPVATLPLGSGA